MNQPYIFKSNGSYLGFINGANIFSRDGIYLGWTEDRYVWDASGKFRGVLNEINGYKYILLNTLQILPLPRLPKLSPLAPLLPNPPANIPAISLPVGYIDGFK